MQPVRVLFPGGRWLQHLGWCMLPFFATFTLAQPPPEVRITAVTRTHEGLIQLEHSATTNFYYILYRGPFVTSIQQPVDVRLPLMIRGSLSDSNAPLQQAFYRIEQVPLDQPLDLDNDGIDDVYELQHASFLNPLDPRDVGFDFDQDGRSNLQEYRGGTDPTRSTPPAPLAPKLQATPAATRDASLPIQGSGLANLTARIEGGGAAVTATVQGNGNFSAVVPLRPNALNHLIVSLVDAQGQTGPSVALQVLQDTQPPSLIIDFPPDGSELSTDTTTVAGRVGDLLSGFMGLSVSVSNVVHNPTAGGPANVAVGVGSNGTFERSGVPLARGTNNLVVTATDALGNAIARQISVIRTTSTGARLVQVSGDRQANFIHQRLLAPLVVKVVHGDGSAFPNKTVNLEVIRSDGRLLPVDPKTLAVNYTNRPDADSNGAGFIQLTTDSQGLAQAWWTLGTDAGCANNRVAVTSRDISGTVYFCASAEPASASQINIGSGNNQRAEVRSLAPEPLRAWVNDSCNGIAGVVVTFRVVQGGGKVDGEDTTSVLTAKTGHADVDFTLGPEPGNNVIEADFDNNPSGPASFKIFGIKRDLNQPTSFSGVVLSEASQPLGHATCRLTVGAVSQSALTDENGQFRFALVPPGPAQLLVDGATATAVGTNTVPTNSFPELTFAATLIPNADNSLGKPIVLPRRNPSNSRLYLGTTDLELTCEGVPGLKLTIRANSMRHANGTPVTPQNPVTVSLNPLHSDSLPRPLPNGASPPFAWAFEPGDAQFDLPVQVEYPNVSQFPPGSEIFFLGLSHQTERFEIVGSGRVDPTGAKIVSYPEGIPLGSPSGTSVRTRGLAVVPGPGSGGNGPVIGSTCPPYPTPGHCGSCVVPIKGPKLVQLQKDITLTTTDSPVDWNYEALDGDVTLDPQGSSVKVTGKKEGTVRIIAESKDGDRTCRGEYRVRVGQCPEDTIPLPDPFSGRAGGWSFGGVVSPDSGTWITGLTLGRHLLAEHLSVPYVFISLGLPGGGKFEQAVPLRPDSTASSARCRLVGFEGPQPGAAEASVKAKYMIDRLPDDSSQAKLCIIQRYRFRGYDPDDHCNPFGVACARFYPITEYEFYEDPDVPITLQQVTIPQLIKFGIDNPNNVGTFTTELVPPVLAKGGNPLQQESSFSAVLDGGFSQVDNFHGTYLPSVTVPTLADPTAGCHECVHIHWRWSKIASLLGLYYGGFDSNFGKPMIPVGSRQSVQVGMTAFHGFSDYSSSNWQLAIDGEFLGVPREVLFWYEGTSSDEFDSFFTHGGFYLPELPAPNTLAPSTNGRGIALSTANPPAPYTLDPDSPLVPLAPKRYGALDESWTLSVAGQSVQADSDGGFLLQNISAPDAFGADGPGSPPDGLSDDLVRVKGISTQNGVNRYLTSEFFQIAKDATVSLADLKFSIVPPLSPERLTGTAVTPTLTQSAQTTQINITAHYPDGSTQDVTARSQGTTYRSSNPRIAKISSGGVATAAGPGTAYLTAANEGAATVVQVDVIPGAPLTTLDGFVQDAAGVPVAGAEVTLTGLAARAVTGPDGRFLIADVPIGSGAIRLTAQLVSGTEHLQAVVGNVPLVPGGVSDMGLITLRPAVSPVVPKLATGSNHILVIAPDGSLWGWGANNDGQIGDGTTTERLRPVRVGSDTNWLTVTATEESSAAIKQDGSLWTWGNGRNGVLGLGPLMAEATSPTQVGADNDWQVVEGGDSYLLAVKSDGSLWAWGSNEGGRLGDGTTTDASLPIRIGTDFNWMAVSPGLSDSGSLALKKDGTLWAWAELVTNRTPVQVGTDNNWVAIASREGPTAGDRRGTDLLLKSDGTAWTVAFSARQPQLVQFTPDSDWKTMSVSDDHGLLLKTDGTLWAYGANDSGQLGDGSVVDQRAAPVRVGTQNTFVEMATRYNHNVARTSDGTYYTWGGDNDSGELGRGILRTGQPVPTQVGTDLDWQSVILGAFDAAALKTNGSLWTWGLNAFGELGTGTLAGQAIPTRIGTETDWALISVSSTHMLALKTDGTLWAWGDNGLGELGTGTPDRQLLPKQVGIDHNWISASAGYEYSLAIKTDGTLWAWGYNDKGQLGNGTPDPQFLKPIAIPTQIGTDTDWLNVTAGAQTSYALKKDGSLWAWGASGGILGDGAQTDRPAPVRIGTDLDWAAIRIGSFGRLAVKQDGTLWGWGFDAVVGLGLSGRNLAAPIQIGSDHDWAMGVPGGSEHSLARKTDGTLWSAGEDYYGQLGDGLVNDRARGFAQVGLETAWRSISAAETGSAATKADGTLWTWGNYLSGQLGIPDLLMPRAIGDVTQWKTIP